MDKIETLSHMIINLFNVVKTQAKIPLEGIMVDRISNPVTELEENKLTEVLKKIESYGKLDDINVIGLDFLAIIDSKYPNFYDLLEFFYIPDVFLQEHSIECFIIKLNILNFFTDLNNIKLIDLMDDYPGIDLILSPYIKLDKEIRRFERKIHRMNCHYGSQLEVMTELMFLIYQSRYGNNYDQLYNIIYSWINDCDEEMSINGIKSWFYNYGKDRKKIISFLDNYIYDGLNGKKVIE